MALQNKRLYIGRFGGLQRTMEGHSAPKKKRMEDAKAVVLGDGLSTVEYLHDPAWSVEPITLSYITKKEDPFVGAIDAEVEAHRRDPEGAKKPTMLLAYLDGGTVLGSKTAVGCVIQSVTWPEGDVNANGESKVEIVVQPDDII